MQHYLQLTEINDPLASYVQTVLQGDEIVILQQGEPVAKLMAINLHRQLTSAQRTVRERVLARMRKGYPLGIAGLSRNSLYE